MDNTPSYGLKNFENQCIYQPTGVLVIGAFVGNELDQYPSDIPMVLFEPQMRPYQTLHEKYGNNPRFTLVNAALGSDPNLRTIMMNVETANGGQSSSCLTPKEHLSEYPYITFNSKISVLHFTLDNWLSRLGDASKVYNTIQLDVQGFELEVLKGATKTLSQIDSILTEVNYSELYENCVLIDKLDEFLISKGFHRTWSSRCKENWGDAIYLRNKS